MNGVRVMSVSPDRRAAEPRLLQRLSVASCRAVFSAVNPANHDDAVPARLPKMDRKGVEPFKTGLQDQRLPVRPTTQN